MSGNTFPKLHNAMWPGLVGKGPDAEPPIDLDTMLDLTAAAEVDGVKFDGVDLFLYDPHIIIDRPGRRSSASPTRSAARGSWSARSSRRSGRRSAAARRWDDGRAREVPRPGRQGLPDRAATARAGRPPVRRRPDRLGDRRADWAKNPAGNQKKIAETFKRGRDIAERPRRAAGRRGRNLLGRHALLAAHGRPARAGRRAGDARLPGRHGAHAALHAGRQRARGSHPARRITTGRTARRSTRPSRRSPHALRPWTIDFHVAQNDATVFGSGSHDQTGRHCLATIRTASSTSRSHAGFWLRDEKGELTKVCQHICWDGCMFPNAVMMKPKTWNDILAAMIAVRDAHGWVE